VTENVLLSTAALVTQESSVAFAVPVMVPITPRVPARVVAPVTPRVTERVELLVTVVPQLASVTTPAPSSHQCGVPTARGEQRHIVLVSST
jgi:hypothetical protein